MAARDVQILKDAGSMAVRYANGNLRIPGFRLLEHCNTTVDMDRDPEVFMMLEPVVVVRNLNKATPNTDSRDSSRRLRFIFKAVIMFFRWRLPSGEKMLRENGIDNLPNEVFEEIRAALVQSDGHFARFSAMTIKRCLQIFTASVMDHARTLLPTAKGDTTARDLAREAWQSVKHFKAMLTQDWATIADPTESFSSGPPGSGPPSSGPPASGPPTAGGPAAGPSTTGQPTTEPSGALSQNRQQSTSSTRPGEPSFSSAATGAAVPAPPANPISAATIPGLARGGRAALEPKPRGGRVSRPSHQDINTGGPSSRPNTKAPPRTPENKVTRGANPSGTSVLGKHPRAEPDIDDANTCPPAAKQKVYDNEFDAARAGPEAREAWYEREIEKCVASRHEWEDKAWAVKATHKELACEVLDLRRRVRELEKEKVEALSNQSKQLRPGLVTMKMSPRVQQRVNQLCPPTGNGSAESTRAPWSYHDTWAPWPDTRTPHHVGIETWLDHIQNEAASGDDETLPPPWDETPDHRREQTKPSQRQEQLKTGPGLPPVGYFRHPTPTKSNRMTKSKNQGAETWASKKWTYKRYDWETQKVISYDTDTESSWASTIPA